MNENPSETRSYLGLALKWAIAFVVAGGLVVGSPQLWQSVQEAREAGRRTQCSGQLMQIATAMYHYQQKYGCYPPAYVANKAGRPMHSWRVLLLPFVECEAIYRDYRFDEPWNSPHNLALAEREPPAGKTGFPRCYHCPCERDSDRFYTSYVMVVGPKTISAGPTSTRLRDIADGASNTIMIAEMSDSGILWTEPRDLKFDEMTFRINDPEGRGLRSNHRYSRGINTVFCDGTVHVIRDDIDPQLLKGLLTRNGGEDVSRFHNH